MRRSTLILVSFLLLTGVARAQAPVALPPCQVSAYRPVGEQRLWTFVVHDSTIGRLISTITGPTEMGGETGIAISEQLSLDYRKTGSDLVLQIQANHVVTETGRYLGDHLSINSGGQTDTLELARAGDSLVGFVTRGGVRQPTSLFSPAAREAWDVPFVDQIEMYLAVHGVTVGAVINDTIFAPHPMISMPIRGVVDSFGYVSLYNKLADSVFVIRLSQPQQMRLLFNRQRRLVKAEFPQEQTKIYLDAVSKAKGGTETKRSSVSAVVIISRIPAYIVYLILAVAVLLFFVGRQITSVYGYLGFGIAAAVFWLVPFTQVPVQEAIIVHKMLPAIRAGESVLLWGIWPALVAGIIQTALLAGVIALIRPEKKLGPGQLRTVGAFVGAGFGFMEACYFTATAPFFTLASYGLIERAFVLVFQLSAGLLLGIGIRRGSAYYLQTALCLALVNALLRYLPAFAQQRVVGPELLSVLLALVSLAVVFTALVQTKRSSSGPIHDPAKTASR